MKAMYTMVFDDDTRITEECEIDLNTHTVIFTRQPEIRENTVREFVTYEHDGQMLEAPVMEESALDSISEDIGMSDEQYNRYFTY